MDFSFHLHLDNRQLIAELNPPLSYSACLALAESKRALIKSGSDLHWSRISPELAVSQLSLIQAKSLTVWYQSSWFYVPTN